MTPMYVYRHNYSNPANVFTYCRNRRFSGGGELGSCLGSWRLWRRILFILNNRWTRLRIIKQVMNLSYCFRYEHWTFMTAKSAIIDMLGPRFKFWKQIFCAHIGNYTRKIIENMSFRTLKATTPLFPLTGIYTKYFFWRGGREDLLFTKKII